MTGNGHQNRVCVSRVNDDLRNLLAVTQTKVRPRLARVSRFVDAIAN
jgi:hypothetical protein